MNIKQFKKQEASEDIFTTSINLSLKRHKPYLDRVKINLSALVRSMLDEMIQDDEKNQVETLKKAG